MGICRFLLEFYTGKQEKTQGKEKTRTQLTSVRNKLLKLIRSKCLDCSAGSSNEVRLCPVKDCPLWPFRLGNNKSDPLPE